MIVFFDTEEGIKSKLNYILNHQVKLVLIVITPSIIIGISNLFILNCGNGEKVKLPSSSTGETAIIFVVIWIKLVFKQSKYFPS